ncbi:MAG: GHKL domain-containing protein [Candidatus Margulisbacteria bacterium]|nr:GHKL domain-containing protein [Candidatus Margulisiibacteriota bacterium]
MKQTLSHQILVPVISCLILGFVVFVISSFVIVQDAFDTQYKVIQETASANGSLKLGSRYISTFNDGVEAVILRQFWLGIVLLGLTTLIVYWVIHRISKSIGHSVFSTEKSDHFEQLDKTHRDMYDAQKRETIAKLSAGVAHEINNPLGFVENNIFSLQLYVTKLKEILTHHEEFFRAICDGPYNKELSQLETKQKELKIDHILTDLDDLFSQTLEGIRRINAITKALSDFSGRGMQENGALNLNKAIENTLIVSRYEYRNKINVKTNFGEVPEIMCHVGKINQVLLNLILNATQAVNGIEHTDKGEIHIRTFQEGVFVYCEISDNGPGIKKEDMKKVFDPFYSKKSDGKGIGLGLNISYDIIKQHGGDITVGGEKGKGATFTVKLPIHSLA